MGAAVTFVTAAPHAAIQSRKKPILQGFLLSFQSIPM